MLATVPERRSDGLAWRNLLSGIGAGEGGVGHGEVGWVGVCPHTPLLNRISPIPPRPPPTYPHLLSRTYLPSLPRRATLGKRGGFLPALSVLFGFFESFYPSHGYSQVNLFAICIGEAALRAFPAIKVFQVTLDVRYIHQLLT